MKKYLPETFLVLFTIAIFSALWYSLYNMF